MFCVLQLLVEHRCHVIYKHISKLMKIYIRVRILHSTNCIKDYCITEGYIAICCCIFGSSKKDTAVVLYEVDGKLKT